MFDIPEELPAKAQDFRAKVKRTGSYLSQPLRKVFHKSILVFSGATGAIAARAASTATLASGAWASKA